MEVSYIQLVKIDHDNNNVVVEPIDEQENIKHYVMDMLARATPARSSAGYSPDEPRDTCRLICMIFAS